MRTHSDVQAWNVSLFKMGHTQKVLSSTERTPEAEACDVFWDDCIVQTLEAFPWHFARKQVELSTPSGVERVGWSYVYTMPDDCITPIALLPEGTKLSELGEADRHAFEVHLDDEGTGNIIVSDASFVDNDFDVLEYTALVDVPRMWNAQFVDAVTWLLASKLALALPKDKAMAAGLMQFYQRSINAALANDRNMLQRPESPTTPGMAAR